MKPFVLIILGIGLLMGAIACSDSKGDEGMVNASAVVDHLISEGLEAENSRDMKPEDFGPLPQNAVSAQVFYIPTLGPNVNGHVYVFDNTEDLEKMIEAYEEHRGMFSIWLFEKENVLLHLSGHVDDEEAEEYEAALSLL